MAKAAEDLHSSVARTNEESGSFPWVGTTIGVALIWVVAAVVFSTEGSEDGGPFALLLLVIPVAGSCWVVARYGASSRFLTAVAPATLLLVLFQAVFLGAYTLRSGFGLWIYPTLSVLSLVAAACIVVGALALASHMLRPHAEKGGSRLFRRNGLVRSLSRHPFAAICFFVSAFCLVAAYLAFSLTFHDQGLRARLRGQSAIEERASIKPNQPAPVLRTGLYGTLLPPFAEESAGEGVQTDPRATASDRRTWRVRFPKGATTVSCDDRYRTWQLDEIATLQNDDLRLSAENARELFGLVEEIASHGDRARVRVLLVGHADDTPLARPSHDYPSNYELSEARIHQVMAEVVRRLETRGSQWRENVEWLLLPFSSAESFLDPATEYLASPAETRLIVEAAVMPSSHSLEGPPPPPPEGRAFELLDYLYFTLYTITTTGYGDIVPVSAFAKFTTSIGNLFEVVFIVIFFNVLVSFLRDGHERLPPSSPPAADAPSASP